MKEDREYTEKQQKFLIALFSPECRGDVREAMNVAGYSEHTLERDIVESLREEILSGAEMYMEQIGLNAMFTVQDIIKSKEPVLGARDKLVAAKDIMDRAGMKKTQTVEVDTDMPIVYLPAKVKREDDDEL